MYVCLSVPNLWKRVWKTMGVRFLVILGHFYIQIAPVKKKIGNFYFLAPYRGVFYRKLGKIIKILTFFCIDLRTVRYFDMVPLAKM